MLLSQNAQSDEKVILSGCTNLRTEVVVNLSTFCLHLLGVYRFFITLHPPSPHSPSSDHLPQCHFHTVAVVPSSDHCCTDTVLSSSDEERKSVYYVIGGPYVSDQAGLNRGPLILIVFHCYFVSTFCDDRINTFLFLISTALRW